MSPILLFVFIHLLKIRTQKASVRIANPYYYKEQT